MKPAKSLATRSPVAGGLTTVGACVAAACFAAVTGPVVAPILAVSGGVAMVGSVTGSGSQFLMNAKNEWRKDDVEQCMQSERVEMEKLAKELQKLPVYKGLAQKQKALKKVLEKVYGLNALGVSFSPEEVEKNADLIDRIVGDDSTGFANETHSRVLEKLQELKIPGLEQLVSDGGLLQMGAEMGAEMGVEGAVEAIGGLVAENVIPTSALFLPHLVRKLADNSHKFNEQHYRTAADAVRKTAQKLEKDGEKVVVEQQTLLRSIEYELQQKRVGSMMKVVAGAGIVMGILYFVLGKFYCPFLWRWGASVVSVESEG